MQSFVQRVKASQLRGSVITDFQCAGPSCSAIPCVPQPLCGGHAHFPLDLLVHVLVHKTGWITELRMGGAQGAFCEREPAGQKEGTSVNETWFGLGMEAGAQEHRDRLRERILSF